MNQDIDTYYKLPYENSLTIHEPQAWELLIAMNMFSIGIEMYILL